MAEGIHNVVTVCGNTWPVRVSFRARLKKD